MNYSQGQRWVLEAQFLNPRHSSFKSQNQSQKKNDEIPSLAKMHYFTKGNNSSWQGKLICWCLCNQLYLQVTKSFSRWLQEEVLAVPGLCWAFYYFQNSWSHSFPIKSLWGPSVGISTLYCTHSVAGEIERHGRKVTCLHHTASCAVRDLLFHQRNFTKILVLFVWLAHDSVSGDVSSFFGSVSNVRKFRMRFLRWICFSDLWDHCVSYTDWS